MMNENKETIEIFLPGILWITSSLSRAKSSLQISVEFCQIKIANIEIKIREHKSIVHVPRDKTSLKNNNSEPWASRWIAVPVGYLCSKERV